MRAIVLAATLVLSGVPARADTVADVVFAPGRFTDAPASSVLRYRFEVRGAAETERVEPIRVEIGTAGADGSKPVRVVLFTGNDQREVGPLAAREQNPLLILLLQLDVDEMGKLTGGAPGYFQKRIREAFAKPATTEAVTIDLEGRSVAAQRVVFRPFERDPQIARFPRFEDKAYAMTVSDDVPGGIWRFETVTPDPTTHAPILTKTLSFEGIDPADRAASGGSSP